jgi:hypothetical protein
MKLVMCAAAIAAFFMARNSAAQVTQDPDPPIPGPELDQPGPKEHQADKVRYQFHESEVPDGVVFQSLLARVSDRYGGDSERTMRRVRNYMEFASDEEVLAFISLLDEKQKRLSTTKLQAARSIICHSDPDRTEQQMYRDVDTLSDIGISLSNYHYDEFLDSLDPEHSAKFSAWVEETKGGYQYYVFKAEESLRDRGQNPAAFYQDECSQIEERLRAVQ